MKKKICPSVLFGLIETHVFTKNKKESKRVCIRCGLLQKETLDYEEMDYIEHVWNDIGVVDSPSDLINKWVKEENIRKKHRKEVVRMKEKVQQQKMLVTYYKQIKWQDA